MNPAPNQQRLRLDYFDHNDAFATQLPREGEVVAELSLPDSAEPLYLVHLDQPVCWEGGSYSRLLLMSRWALTPICGRDPTSVHVLLVPDDAHPTNGQSITQYLHVAWGLARSA